MLKAILASVSRPTLRVEDLDMENSYHYDLLADLLSYPKSNFLERIALLQEVFNAEYPQAAQELEQFTALLPQTEGVLSGKILDEMEELFTRSFEVQCITTLDVGYVAFGDDYKRAELLVNLKREQREYGIDCGAELSDYLPNILRLLAQWKNADIMTEFVKLILYPCVESMILEFEPERIAQRNALYKKHYKTLIASNENRAPLYLYALSALRQVLQKDFRLTSQPRPEKTSDFLRSIHRELEIEAKGAGQKPSAALQQTNQSCGLPASKQSDLIQLPTRRI